MQSVNQLCFRGSSFDTWVMLQRFLDVQKLLSGLSGPGLTYARVSHAQEHCITHSETDDSVDKLTISHKNPLNVFYNFTAGRK